MKFVFEVSSVGKCAPIPCVPIKRSVRGVGSAANPRPSHHRFDALPGAADVTMKRCGVGHPATHTLSLFNSSLKFYFSLKISGFFIHTYISMFDFVIYKP